MLNLGKDQGEVEKDTNKEETTEEKKVIKSSYILLLKT